ncbi:hypothetical protein LLB_2871 [Legionella longbeachae D-4968]|nr:hypothetical protein LLB_2871 [Legionella longbeachae D-4968]
MQNNPHLILWQINWIDVKIDLKIKSCLEPFLYRGMARSHLQ